VHWLGVGSCSATACHGGDGPAGTRGSEYTAWAACDPHANAFSVLYNERSERIIKNLNGPKGKPACCDSLCLGCHATDVNHALQAPRLALEDGVGCESCHGPAGEWLTRHYRPGWKGLSPAEKARWGMRDTKDLAVRAKTCVECHVGAGDKDVNHDLIAAGHPRLNFEYGSYLAILPRHWSVRQERARYPDFEARAWAIGQVAAAQQALELLAHRAREEHKKPWPEFAEYNCFSCHHDLREPSRWRKEKPERPLGSPAWGSWYFSDVLPDALAYATGKGEARFTRTLKDLRAEMQKPLPGRQGVEDLTRRAIKELNPWLRKLDEGGCKAPAYLRKEMRSFTEDGKDLDNINWDEAAQRYLALAAFYNAASDLAPRPLDPALKGLLTKMAKGLEFKDFDSPYYFDPKVFRRQLEGIHDLLGK
jgi:hypothetical protein